MSDPTERLIAYLDGELDPQARAAFEAAMAADPELAARVEAHRELGASLSAAFDPVLAEPVPLRLTLAAQAANDPAPSRFRAPQWAAMAACLVAGVLVGRLALTDRGPLTQTAGGLAARGELAQALSTGLAADAGPIRVGLTFRDQQGRYCRTFQSRPDALAGLACRQDGRWAMRATAAWAPAQSPDYRTAGSETPPAILAAVDQLRAGDPLDAPAERAARDGGWGR